MLHAKLLCKFTCLVTLVDNDAFLLTAEIDIDKQERGILLVVLGLVWQGLLAEPIIVHFSRRLLLLLQCANSFVLRWRLVFVIVGLRLVIDNTFSKCLVEHVLHLRLLLHTQVILDLAVVLASISCLQVDCAIAFNWDLVLLDMLRLASGSCRLLWHLGQSNSLVLGLSGRLRLGRSGLLVFYLRGHLRQLLLCLGRFDRFGPWSWLVGLGASRHASFHDLFYPFLLLTSFLLALELLVECLLLTLAWFHCLRTTSLVFRDLWGKRALLAKLLEFVIFTAFLGLFCLVLAFLV